MYYSQGVTDVFYIRVSFLCLFLGYKPPTDPPQCQTKDRVATQKQ